MCLRGSLGAGETAQCLTALYALAEDQGSVSSTHVVSITPTGDPVLS